MRISDWSSDVCSSDLAFWQSIRKGKAPKPEYSRDGDVIAEIYSNATDDVKDLRADNRAVMLAAEYLSAKQMEKQSAAEADAIKAELLEKLGEAGTGLLDSFKIGRASCRERVCQYV